MATKEKKGDMVPWGDLVAEEDYQAEMDEVNEQFKNLKPSDFKAPPPNKP